MGLLHLHFPRRQNSTEEQKVWYYVLGLWASGVYSEEQEKVKELFIHVQEGAILGANQYMTWQVDHYFIIFLSLTSLWTWLHFVPINLLTGLTGWFL